MRHVVYLSLGSNLGNREHQLRDAIARLESHGRILCVSSLYETEPVDVADQAWFLNCVVSMETTIDAQELMTALLGIEHDMGRKRTQNKGPRTIDIDILLFSEEVIDLLGLTVPHPAMHERRFVLEPLAEIAPEARHPVLMKTARELLDALPQGQIVRRHSG